MNAFYKSMKATFGWIFKRLYRVKVVNPEKEVFGQPYIVCCNHTSMMDGPMITVGLKTPVRCMAKQEIFKVPFVGMFLKSMGAFPIDRSKGDIAAVRLSIDILKKGECLGIFPQGTRMPYVNPEDAEIKSGIGMFADRAGVGILPVCVRTKKNKVGIFRKTRFIIGDFIPPQDLKFEGYAGREKYQKIADYAFSKVAELYNEDVRYFEEKKRLKKEKKQRKKDKKSKK